MLTHRRIPDPDTSSFRVYATISPTRAGERRPAGLDPAGNTSASEFGGSAGELVPRRFWLISRATNSSSV
jgi:hypothetical protein